MEIPKEITSAASAISTIVLLVVMFVKPLRNTFLGLHELQDGQKCMLRSKMLRIYYKHIQDQEVHQYEYENFMYAYKAYKALHGNSFIEHVKNEVETWSVVR